MSHAIHRITISVLLLVTAGCAAQAQEDQPTAPLTCGMEETANDTLTGCLPIPEVTDSAICYEDMACWDWQTMGNHSSGAVVTLHTGETWNVIITANGDDTYTLTHR